MIIKVQEESTKRFYKVTKYIMDLVSMMETFAQTGELTKEAKMMITRNHGQEEKKDSQKHEE